MLISWRLSSPNYTYIRGLLSLMQMGGYMLCIFYIQLKLQNGTSDPWEGKIRHEASLEEHERFVCRRYPLQNLIVSRQLELIVFYAQIVSLFLFIVIAKVFLGCKQMRGQFDSQDDFQITLANKEVDFLDNKNFFMTTITSLGQVCVIGTVCVYYYDHEVYAASPDPLVAIENDSKAQQELKQWLAPTPWELLATLVMWLAVFWNGTKHEQLYAPGMMGAITAANMLLCGHFVYQVVVLRENQSLSRHKEQLFRHYLSMYVILFSTVFFTFLEYLVRSRVQKK